MPSNVSDASNLMPKLAQMFLAALLKPMPYQKTKGRLSGGLITDGASPVSTRFY